MGILAAAVLSASMSSLSSAFNSLATVSVVGYYQRFFKPEASPQHYLTMSRIFTIVWAGLAIPIAFAFVNSGGSILETLSRVASYFVGAKLAMFGLGFLSKHTSERGLLVGVAAGFIGLFAIVAGVPIIGLEPANVAWPWYVVIGGVINIVVSWTASVLIDGFQSDWHEQTVMGQLRKFKAEGRAEKQDGWYIVPGRVDSIAWYLLLFFVFILLFLSWFGTLGG